jgi:hypothetical protein
VIDQMQYYTAGIVDMGEIPAHLAMVKKPDRPTELIFDRLCRYLKPIERCYPNASFDLRETVEDRNLVAIKWLWSAICV